MASSYKSGYRSGFASGYQSQFPSSTAPAPVPPTTGLKLWLKADAGVTLSGSNVTAWADQSGSGNNVSQSTGSEQPVINSSSINGLPGITFGSPRRLAAATSPLTAGSDRSVIVVCLPGANAGGIFNSGGTLVSFRTATPTWTGFLCDNPGGSNVLGYTVTGSGYDALTSAPAVLNVPSAVAIYTTVGSYPTFRMNGTGYTSSTAVLVGSDTGTDGLLIGFNVISSAEFFAGDICEVLVYDHILTTQDKATVAAYILSRYALVL